MTDFERSLLASAKSDAMPADRKRALVAAFAGGAVLSVAGAANAATGAAAAAKKTGASIALVKWIAAGALGTALVAGATTGALRVYERDASAPAAISTTTGPRSRAPTQMTTPEPTPKPVDPVGEVITPPAAEPAPEPAAEIVAARGAASPPARRPTRATAAPSLSEELAVIEKARAALASGDAASADRALDEHARSFPRGAFTDEARVLRIDAHARRGDRERTVAAARRYLAAHPDSPYGAHVRAYLEDRP